MRRRWRGLPGGVALILIGALLALPPNTAAKTSRFNYCADQSAVFPYPRAFIGVGDLSVQSGSDRYLDCSLGRMAAAGIGVFRAAINWQDVELAPNYYSFVFYDSFVAYIARHHMRLLGLLDGAPAWASTAPSTGALPGAYPPANPAQFAQFAALCVQRYGPDGSFWRENPGIPYDPVQAWEIWNEPNLAQYWEPRPNVRAYVTLLKDTYTAIKAVDPSATVVTGGTPFYGNADETQFISQMYRWGAKGYFNAYGIHPYSATVAQAEQRLKTARRLLDRYGNGTTPLWVTELGWAGGDPDAFISSPSRQRVSVTNFFRFVRRTRAQLRLAGVIWDQWQDRVNAPGPRSWWGFHLGLVNESGRPKPALAAIAAAARQLER